VQDASGASATTLSRVRVEMPQSEDSIPRSSASQMVLIDGLIPVSSRRYFPLTPGGMGTVPFRLSGRYRAHGSMHGTDHTGSRGYMLKNRPPRGTTMTPNAIVSSRRTGVAARGASASGAFSIERRSARLRDADRFAGWIY
jgi:hypothetical protein